jgi:Transcriptional regulator
MEKQAKGAGEGRAGEETRAALVAQALILFGAKGYEATSTREIAAAAGTNIASIAYHFGGKEGLRVACAELVAQRLMAVAGKAVLMADPGGDPARALAMVEMAASAFVGFLLGQPQARDIAIFVVRELSRPGTVFETIYPTAFEPMHRKLCALLGLAAGCDPESDDIRLGAFTLIGQAIYFRIGYFIVMRRMEWEEIGPPEIEAVRATIIGNIRAFVAARRGREQ